MLDIGNKVKIRNTAIGTVVAIANNKKHGIYYLFELDRGNPVIGFMSNNVGEMWKKTQYEKVIKGSMELKKDIWYAWVFDDILNDELNTAYTYINDLMPTE